MNTMNGVHSWGVKIRVAKTWLGDSWKVDERQDFEDEQRELRLPAVSNEYRLSHPSFDREQGQS